jgi:hypothetical protein
MGDFLQNPSKIDDEELKKFEENHKCLESISKMLSEGDCTSWSKLQNFSSIHKFKSVNDKWSKMLTEIQQSTNVCMQKCEAFEPHINQITNMLENFDDIDYVKKNKISKLIVKDELSSDDNDDDDVEKSIEKFLHEEVIDDTCSFVSKKRVQQLEYNEPVSEYRMLEPEIKPTRSSILKSLSTAAKQKRFNEKEIELRRKILRRKAPQISEINNVNPSVRRMLDEAKEKFAKNRHATSKAPINVVEIKI